MKHKSFPCKTVRCYDNMMKPWLTLCIFTAGLFAYEAAHARCSAPLSGQMKDRVKAVDFIFIGRATGSHFIHHLDINEVERINNKLNKLIIQRESDNYSRAQKHKIDQEILKLIEVIAPPEPNSYSEFDIEDWILKPNLDVKDNIMRVYYNQNPSASSISYAQNFNLNQTYFIAGVKSKTGDYYVTSTCFTDTLFDIKSEDYQHKNIDDIRRFLQP